MSCRELLTLCVRCHMVLLKNLKFCLYLLPLRAILKWHGIGCHVYIDDSGLYISFMCNNSLICLATLNNNISDIRVWMIKNNFKINDSKTSFIDFLSLQAKQDLSGLLGSVGDGIIQKSSKVMDLGVIFDQFLRFAYYLSSVCNLHTFT